MLIENAKSRAVRSGRHNHEDNERSHDAVYVWRVSGENGKRFRFSCRMGQLSVYEEPIERHILTVNIGRLAEVRRRALLVMKSQKASLPVIRKLTHEEEIACWAKAAADPEMRFFETLKGGPERLGGRWQTLRSLAAVLEFMGSKAPWPDRPDLG
ncbi:MAG: hypothetical protein FGM15_03345 [Chthoniobacterales bacterium]|nr:hypothetical protein [Chthoniobacterales bacterium]